MKNFYTKKIKLTLAAVALCVSGASAQLITSTFEELTLPANSYNDGSTGSGNFTSGTAVFHNTYNSAWMYWDSGFAYSNQGDTTTSPSDYMTQTYQTKAGMGYDSSIIFAIGQQGASMTFDTSYGPIEGGWGVYITNTTYAYNSMALGDGFGKKFGDTSQTIHSAPGINQGAPDWFKLSIVGYNFGVATGDTVDFYLADFRFANNSQDYIVKDWQYVDLSQMEHVDSLQFVLTSSDMGSFGINTPTYFCIDNFITNGIVTGIASLSKSTDFNVYPNPFEDNVTVDFKNANKRLINVYNAFGALISKSETSDAKVELKLNGFDAGIYFVNVIEEGKSSTVRVIKNK